MAPVPPRGPADPEPVAALQQSSAPPFVLMGIVRGDDLGIAVLRNNDSMEVKRVRSGDKVAGWTIGEVGTRHVVLHRDAVSVRLQLFQQQKQN